MPKSRYSLNISTRFLYSESRIDEGLYTSSYSPAKADEDSILKYFTLAKWLASFI